MHPLANMAHRLAETLRYRLATGAFLFGAAVLMMAALGFSIAGGYLWLAMQLPTYLAAFSVAGILCLLSLIVILVAARRQGSDKKPLNADQPARHTEAEEASAQIIRSALTVTLETPIKAVAAATAVGFIVGLLRAKK